MCTSWMCAVRSAGTRNSMSPAPSAAASLPPSRPLSASVQAPAACAASTAAAMFGRTAAGGDRDQRVARARQRLHLLREHLIEMVVVADRGERRGVGGERNRRKRRTLALEAVGELGGEVLGIGGRTAVAADENLAAVAQCRSKPDGCCGYRARKRIARALLRFDCGGEMIAYTFLIIHVMASIAFLNPFDLVRARDRYHVGAQVAPRRRRIRGHE